MVLQVTAMKMGRVMYQKGGRKPVYLRHKGEGRRRGMSQEELEDDGSEINQSKENRKQKVLKHTHR